MGKRLIAKLLALELNLSPQRIGQMRQDGILIRGQDNKYDLDEARAAHIGIQSLHPVAALLTEYSNGRSVSPTKLATFATNSTPAAEVDEFGLPLSVEEIALRIPPDANGSTAAREMLAANMRMQALKERKLETDIARQDARLQREAGLLVPREDVWTQGVAAGKVIASILAGMAAEVASAFADPASRVQVQRAVQIKVEQIQLALHSALSQAAPDATTS